MGRGVSYGGGRSSLGYLFGSESEGAGRSNNSSSSSNSSPPPPPTAKKEETTRSPMARRKESSSSPIKWEVQEAPSAQPSPKSEEARSNNPSSSSNSPSPPPPTTKKEETARSPVARRKEFSSSPIKWDVEEAPSAQPGHLKNNYYRSEGQNCGNFITDRPTTKVHAAPGGGSSLGYLFGDPNKK
ncbi:unnamed protein product [Linum tenue]|uniref:Uncharacterized protein n=1 Tax=Linum tenue TaxID=586396 RepID=A0AAV0HSI6_9ROSI|nr:unnamed protein product [Linum tenue]